MFSVGGYSFPSILIPHKDSDFYTVNKNDYNVLEALDLQSVMYSVVVTGNAAALPFYCLVNRMKVENRCSNCTVHEKFVTRG